MTRLRALLRRSTSTPTRRGYRPRIEALEDRATPASFTAVGPLPYGSAPLVNNPLTDGPVVDSHGNLFDTAQNYSTSGDTQGWLFEVPAGQSPVVKPLYTFSALAGDGMPNTHLVIDSAGDLFGTDTAGNIFEWQAATQTMARVATLNGQGSNATIGTSPGDLILSGGMLYGTTNSGGQGGVGAVYSVPAAPNSTPQLIGTFTGYDPTSGNTYGSSPNSGLFLSGGVLYGTTQAGGLNNSGIVFSVPVNNANNAAITTVASFPSLPSGSLLLPTNNGYVVVSNGFVFGTDPTDPSNATGSVFYASIATSSFNQNVQTIPFSTVNNSAQGANPVGGLIDDNGLIVGATSGGGVYGDGTVFTVDPAAKTISSSASASFNHENTTDQGAVNPFGSLSFDANGNIYGAAQPPANPNSTLLWELSGLGGNAIPPSPPTVFHWTGKGATANWSNVQNWQEGVAPQAGQPLTLIFPDLAVLPLSVIDDIPNLNVASLQLQGLYNLFGNSIKLSGAINDTSLAGESTIYNLLALAGTPVDNISVSSNSQLDLRGIISGTVGIAYNGPGQLWMQPGLPGALQANTYQGPTYLNNGTVQIFSSNDFGTGTLSFLGGTLNTGTSAATLSNNVVVINGAAKITGTGSYVGETFNLVTFTGLVKVLNKSTLTVGSLARTLFTSGIAPQGSATLVTYGRLYVSGPLSGTIDFEPSYNESTPQNTYLTLSNNTLTNASLTYGGHVYTNSVGVTSGTGTITVWGDLVVNKANASNLTGYSGALILNTGGEIDADLALGTGLLEFYGGKIGTNGVRLTNRLTSFFGGNITVLAYGSSPLDFSTNLSVLHNTTLTLDGFVTFEQNPMFVGNSVLTITSDSSGDRGTVTLPSLNPTHIKTTGLIKLVTST